jgi:hypothetical protein
MTRAVIAKLRERLVVPGHVSQGQWDRAMIAAQSQPKKPKAAWDKIAAASVPLPTAERMNVANWRQPGDVLTTLIYHATSGKVDHGLDCEKVRLWMNKIGWRGCLAKDARKKLMKRIRMQAVVNDYQPGRVSLAWRLGLAVFRSGCPDFSSHEDRLGGT